MNAADPSPQPAPHAHEAATVRTAPLVLWRVAQALLGVLHMLFGAPETVAAQHTLTAKAHAQMASWLRTAEAMMRRLLLIEAGAYPRPNTRPLLRAARKRTPKLKSFTPEAPTQWRVSFRCFQSHRAARAKAKQDTAANTIRAFVFHDEPPAPRPLGPHRRGQRVRHPPMRRQDRPWVQAQTPLAVRSAWPLAERYEALLRVFNAPAAYAQRLARRLHATPHRLHETLHAPPEAYGRVDLFEDLGAQARAIWRPHLNSS
jgi:hypothetical protein